VEPTATLVSVRVMKYESLKQAVSVPTLRMWMRLFQRGEPKSASRIGNANMGAPADWVVTSAYEWLFSRPGPVVSWIRTEARGPGASAVA